MPASTAIRRRRALCALASFAVLVSPACSKLPDAAAPKLRGAVTYDMLASLDVIPYRPLTRQDFKGTRPPPEFASLASQLGAATCSHLLTAPSTRVRITERRDATGARAFEAKPYNVRFRAVMDRTCSWWNDRLAAFHPGYVLEHEQIHFAITELEARRLNASVTDFMRDASFTAETPQAAIALAHEAIQRKILEGSEVILARSRAFDEDTSMGYRPEAQRRWRVAINRELAATRRFAEP